MTLAIASPSPADSRCPTGHSLLSVLRALGHSLLFQADSTLSSAQASRIICNSPRIFRSLPPGLASHYLCSDSCPGPSTNESLKLPDKLFNDKASRDSQRKLNSSSSLMKISLSLSPPLSLKATPEVPVGQPGLGIAALESLLGTEGRDKLCSQTGI